MIQITSYIFKSIADAWKVSNSDSVSLDADNETEDERLDRQYREQFPDHAKVFHNIIEAVEAVEFGGDVSNENDVEAKANNFSISEDQLLFLCDLHAELFANNDERKKDDSLRIKSFISTYVAAAVISELI